MTGMGGSVSSPLQCTKRSNDHCTLLYSEGPPSLILPGGNYLGRK